MDAGKNFYIVIKDIRNTNIKQNSEEIIINELNEKYFKIKDCLSRCGNVALEISDKEETKKILFSFFNSRKNFLN